MTRSCDGTLYSTSLYACLGTNSVGSSVAVTVACIPTPVTRREVLARDPSFDMPTFLKGVRGQVPAFERAFAEGDMARLRRMGSEELAERLEARVKALR